MKADAKTKAEVLAALRGMWKAYCRKDAPAVLACYTPDADTLVLGSGGDETYLGPRRMRQGLTRDFSQADAARVALSKVAVSASGKVAWVGGHCEFQGTVNGTRVVMAGRLTAVLEKRRGKWLIAQSHFSMPLAEQKAGQSFPGAKGQRR